MQVSGTSEIQKGRIFILGAGFSAAAGIPMTGSLLERAMVLFRSECTGVFERVQSYTKTAFGVRDSEPNYKEISFSDLCTFLDYVELRESGGKERWSDHGCRERLALKHYLGKAIINTTPQPDGLPELYRAFATQLRETDVIITFNWDCLLEIALTVVGRLYTYGARDNVPLLCKMHGSVHWRIGNQPRLFPSRLRWHPLEFVGVRDTGLYSSNDLLYQEAWQVAEPIGGEVEPFLVLPGYGKAKDVQVLRWLWYKPEGFFALTDEVYIIGLSLAQDDFFVRSFLLYALSDWNGRITVINPDPATCGNYSLLLRPQLSFRVEQFALSHVEEMRSGV